MAFGPRLERRLGPARFLVLFLAAGLASTAALVLMAPNLPIATIGATGAVAGIVGASRSGLILAAAWLALQVVVADLDAAQPVAGQGGDVAYLAPLAGVLVGAAAGLTRPAAARCRTGRRGARPPARAA